MNTRTYPRTLNEAFPNTASYGCAIERPAPRLIAKSASWAVWLALAVIAVAFVLEVS